MSINPHFKVTTGAGADYGALASDLAAAINTLQQPGSTGREVEVKMYDAESAPPNEPLATAVRNKGAAPVSTTAREIAVCLSFYADTNSPSRRGRLYLPYTCFFGSAVGAPALTTVQMDAAAAFVPALSGLGGLNVDWVVWSPKRREAHTVTNWFVDNEWDTVRSRGMRPTTRRSGTTSG
jgi:hypothetical protein